jgi:hypothetical protein
MAGSKSDVFEVDVLKAVTYQATTILVTTPPGTGPFVALFTVDPTDSTGGTEVTGTAYARVDSKGKWGTPTAGSPSSVTNSVGAITFPTAGGNWTGPITSFALMTASSGGSMLSWGTLTTAKTVNSGDTASFGASTLTLTED